MLRFFVILLFFVSSISAIAQEYNQRLDSLVRVAKSASPDSLAVAYYDAGSNLAYFAPQDAIKYLTVANDYAKKDNNYKLVCQCNSFIGISYVILGYFNKAFEYFNHQLSIAINHHVHDEEIWAYKNIALTFLTLQNPDLAIGYLHDALHKCNEINDSTILHHVYTDIGWYHLQKNQLDSAQSFYTKALEIRQKHNVDNSLLAATYRDLGTVAFAKGNFSKAKYWYDVSLKHTDTLTSDLCAEISLNLARIYQVEGDIYSAHQCANKGISLAKKFNNTIMQRNGYQKLGDIYFSLGMFDDAEKCYASHVSISDSLSDFDIKHRVYDMQFIKEVQRQKKDIELVNSNFMGNFLVMCFMALFTVAGFYIASRLRSRNNTIDDINKQLMYQDGQLQDSINYAKRIQKAVLPNFGQEEFLRGNKFLIFVPKLKISGDIHWYNKSGDIFYFAVGSCGKIGITGACLSMFASSMLHELALAYRDPAQIVSGLKDQFKSMMYTFDNNSDLIPDTDISIAVFDTSSMIGYYCGVKFPLICIRDGKLNLIGEHNERNNFFEFEPKTLEVDVRKDDLFYFLTGGVTNQVGKNGEIFTFERLCDMLLSIKDLSMDDQKDAIIKRGEEWSGSQFDKDITIAGFKIV